MMERTICVNFYLPGTLTGNHTPVIEFPFPVRLESIKANASNDSDATLGVTDEDANTVVTAAVIGDSGNPAELTPVDAEVAQIAADKQITLTLDYDGAGGTAAQNVSIQAFFKVGEGA